MLRAGLETLSLRQNLLKDVSPLSEQLQSATGGLNACRACTFTTSATSCSAWPWQCWLVEQHHSRSIQATVLKTAY